MKFLKSLSFLVLLLSASISVTAQNPLTAQNSSVKTAQKPFPLGDLKNWQRIPNSEQDVTITQTTPGPIQFGDIIVQGKPQLTISLILGKSETLVDPVSGDKVIRSTFLNTNEFVLFAWEHPAGNPPTFVLLQEDGTLTTGSNFWVDALHVDGLWLLTDLKIILEGPGGAELASRTIQRKPGVAQPSGQK